MVDDFFDEGKAKKELEESKKTLDALLEGFIEPEAEDIFTSERPNFGKRQIRDLAEIKIGRKYTIHFSGGEEYQYQFLCLSEPFQDKNGTYWIKTRRFDVEGGTEEDKEGLADCGVVPYADFEDDRWSRDNWLEETTDF